MCAHTHVCLCVHTCVCTCVCVCVSGKHFHSLLAQGVLLPSSLHSRAPALAAPAPGSGLRDPWETDNGRKRGAVKGRRVGQAPPEPP